MKHLLDRKFSIFQLHKSHQRQLFSCGITSLDTYLHKQASQDARRNISVTYVLNDESESKVAGYYTLSSATIQLDDLPDDVTKKLPQYPLLPATLIGRLAIDVNYQKQSLGEILLIDAFKRAYEASQKIASLAVVVDAINDKAVKFYKKYGFVSFLMSEDKLFLPMKLINKII